MRTFLRALVLCLPVLLVSARAEATSVPDYLTARGIALGGSRALGFGNESIFLNPAGMFIAKHYTLQLDYGKATAPNEALTSGDGVVVSIGDSVTNPRLATGIAYRYATLEAGGQKKRGSITDFALASPISDMLVAGLKLSYMSFSDGTKEIKKVTGDLAMSLIMKQFIVSVVGFNLLTVDSPESARGVSAGAAFTNGRTYSIGGDIRWQWYDKRAPRSFALGAEYLLFEMFPLRVGYFNDGVSSNKFATAGLGFYLKQFGFDVTYRRNLNTAEGVWMFAGKVFGGGQ